jgi:branched-chain amino acid aminotransferase
VLRLKSPAPEKYENGVRVITAPFPAKDLVIATMKTCSYLHNVLMKKAALDAGADYAVCFDPGGLLTESSTENIAIVSRAGEFLAPERRLILSGTTLKRLMDLAGGLVHEGRLAAALHTDITRSMVREAAEALVCSTSTDVLPIVAWDDEPCGQGRPGPTARELLRRIRAEYTDPASPWVTDFNRPGP